MIFKKKKNGNREQNRRRMIGCEAASLNFKWEKLTGVYLEFKYNSICS